MTVALLLALTAPAGASAPRGIEPGSLPRGADLDRPYVEGMTIVDSAHRMGRRVTAHAHGAPKERRRFGCGAASSSSTDSSAPGARIPIDPPPLVIAASAPIVVAARCRP